MTTAKDEDAEIDMETVRDRYDERREESADRTKDDWPGVGRRPLLKAIGAGAALSVSGGIAAASDGDENDSQGDDGPVSQAEGFEAEVVAPHATFPDDVAAAFGVAYEGGAEDAALVHDASTVVVVRVTLEPGGTSGWHLDQGPVIGSVVEGEIDVTFENDCVAHSYGAGEALVATGRYADTVDNASDTERAVAYLIFLGVPDGEPPSNPSEPPDC